MVEIPATNGVTVLDRRWHEAVMAAEQESTLSAESPITLGEVGRSMLRIERTLDTQRLDTDRKFDSLGKKIDSVIEEMKHDVQVTDHDHEERIRDLEKWMWRAIGIASVGGAGSIAALIATLGR
ncbi:MAG: hypothetical protein OEW29_16240 [Acidimicrobiia bacterium]|nr:hypothetical protein [Acidimicrobiia bacterium]MDH4365428.1 hypothetical protein [Acidimicrobiia bacterium]